MATWQPRPGVDKAFDLIDGPIPATLSHTAIGWTVRSPGFEPAMLGPRATFDDAERAVQRMAGMR